MSAGASGRSGARVRVAAPVKPAVLAINVTEEHLDLNENLF